MSSLSGYSSELPGLAEIVHRALEEDIGLGDVTTVATVHPARRARARIIAKSSGILAGLPVAAETFRQVDYTIALRPMMEDGSPLQPGDVLCEIEGPARGILTGERVALNFLQRMSGIATLTARFVQAVSGTAARVVDTRKTTPGLRTLEKYAVRTGGGRNHRMGLYDAVMVKDNHIIAAGSITEAVRRSRHSLPHTLTVTVECDTLEHVDEALESGADILLLDNMDVATRAEGVRRARGRALTEASGGITLGNAGEIARTGVDILSIGALTHSAPALDIGLDLLSDEV